MAQRKAKPVTLTLAAQVKRAQQQLLLEETQLRRDALKMRRVALSTYRSAEKNRTNRDWRTKPSSADSAILPDLSTLVERARAATRDDCLGASIKRAFVRNVVGKGIGCYPATLAIGGSELYDTQVGRAFWDWSSRRELCDMERRRSFAQVQRWAVGEMIEAGDAFVVMSEVTQPDWSKRLVLQLVESEQLDRYRITHHDDDITRDVRGGVEVDQYGAAVAYWIHPQNPHDFRGRQSGLRVTGNDSVRIMADRVCHVADPERARQTRGVTRFAPSLGRLRNLDDYDFAQVLAAKAEACIGMVIKSPTTTPNLLGMAQPVDEDGGATRKDTDGNDELAMQPLMVARLNEGEDITAFTPTRPGGMYEPFQRTQARVIAAGTGISYEQVMRDFSQGTYSSQRQGMLEDQREYEPLQQLVIDCLCRPVYEAWLKIQAWNFALPISAANLLDRWSVWSYADWRPDGWAWIDPKNEADATTLELDAGLTTRARVLARRGEDYREIARERAAEIQFERSLGLPGTMP